MHFKSLFLLWGNKMDRKTFEMDKELEITNTFVLGNFWWAYDFLWGQKAKIERFDKRIEEISEQAKYYKKDA